MQNFLTTIAINQICRCPRLKLFTEESVEHPCIGLNSEKDILKEAEGQVKSIREKLRTTQSRQKSYADNRLRELAFAPGDHVYLKVSPLKGMRRFRVSGKLAPRYIRLFPILDRRGEVTYQLDLPPRLSEVHDVFHVTQLKKCLRVPEEQMPVEAVDLQQDLTYKGQPIKILEVSERVTRSKVIHLCKVQWSNHTEEKATWQREEDLKAEFSRLFSSQLESRGRDSL